MPFFDPFYYDKITSGEGGKVNTLLHYSLVGRYLKYSPGPFFDTNFYLSENKDVFRNKIDPLLHFYNVGRLEGRSSSPMFTPESIHDILLMDSNGFRSNDVNLKFDLLSSSSFLNKNSNYTTSERKPLVDVILPVSSGYYKTLSCLYSLLINSDCCNYEIVVILDSTTDNRLTSKILEISSKFQLTVVKNSISSGFFKACNLGIQMHPDRDVVILKSGIEVYGDWVERLRTAAYKSSNIGVVTPLSNKGGICSYPFNNVETPYKLEVDWKHIDFLASRNKHNYIYPIPHCEFFCAFIKRDCLVKNVLLEEDNLGRGLYVEINFSLRLRKLGWKCVLCSNTFVNHLGCISNVSLNDKLIYRSHKIIGNSFPFFKKELNFFNMFDPLLFMRRNFDWRRLELGVKLKNILIFTHNRGGGTERCVRDSIFQHLRNGFGVFIIRPNHNGNDFSISHPIIKCLPNLPKVNFNDTNELTMIINRLNITDLHIHSLVDWPETSPEKILSLTKLNKIELSFFVHDYTPLCPFINLADKKGYYCYEPEEIECNKCISSRKPSLLIKDISVWRDRYERLLLESKFVYAPNIDVIQRFRMYFPKVGYTLQAHEDLDKSMIKIKHPKLDIDESLHVVVIGYIGIIKGFNLLRFCSIDVNKKALPIRFSVLGFSINDAKLKSAGVFVKGRYLEQHGLNKLESMNAHAVWLPSIWPETYSYTLSLALKAGLPVLAFDFGAIANRLREFDNINGLMPLSIMRKPKEINNFILNYRLTLINIDDFSKD